MMERTTEPPTASGGGIPDLPTLEVSGELDLAVAPWLADQIDALFVGSSSIVIDLAAATFLDSTALGVLVAANNRSRELGGTVHLIVGEPQILRVLTITGLTETFSVHATRAEMRSGKREQ